MEYKTPRVNSALLLKYRGRNVRLVGKVLSISSSAKTAIFETADSGKVEVRMHEETKYSSPYVEIVGTVDGNNTVNELTYCNLGNDFDLSLANGLIELAQQYPDIFE